MPTTLGGTTIDEIGRMSQSVLTLAVGEHIRASAELLRRRAGVPFRVFDRLTGLEPVDRFVATLMTVSGASVPARVRRQRSRLVDAMLDGHGYFTARPVAIAAEPDLLFALSTFITDLGASVVAAVSPTNGPVLAGVSAENVAIGDLDDLEQAIASSSEIELIMSNAHAGDIARLFDVPLVRVGFPVFDRLGAAQRVTVGYDGTRDLLFQLANSFIERAHAHAGAPATAEHARPRWT